MSISLELTVLPVVFDIFDEDVTESVFGKYTRMIHDTSREKT